MRFLIHTLMLGLALLSFTETYAQGTGSVNLTPISTFNSGVFEGSASEIVAYDPISGRVFVTNATAGGFDILQLSQTGQLGFVTSIATSRPPTHLRIWNDGITSHVVASIPSLPITNPGTVQVFSTSGVLEAVYSVGAFPDMLYITSDGRALTANEGQPIGGTNPRGSVSIVHLATGVVEHISFTGFDGQEVALRNSGIRIFPGFSASVDLEPEYIAVSGDLNFAYAICQEQNCVITIDLTTSTPIRIDSLGKKNHLLPGNGLDPSDSNGVSINTWPVSGLYQPDSIVAFEAAGIPYLLTANEGAARTEDARARTLQLDPGAFPNAGFLQANSRIGRLQVSTIDGDIDGDGDFDELVAYGTRSFSIFEMTTGADIVYDSGDEFALVTSQAAPGNFNSNSTSNNSADGRSDNKGCEPEAATVAHIGNQILAFIGLERQGGIMVYDVTDPPNSFFLGYFTNRNFNANIESPAAGDLGIESIVYVKPADNLLNAHLIITGNEISGTTTVYLLSLPSPPADCNTNNIPDADDISSGTSTDCNSDGIPDECTLTGNDCDQNLIPDDCQPDFDEDGIPNICDNDDDSDGVDDTNDLNPLDSTICRDVDNDGCDDCSSGFDSPSNDGLDTDADGICDLSDPDDDDDGVPDASDSSSTNPFICSDIDLDGCDDCSSGTFNTANDGTDTDTDGICDTGDGDLDGDGIENECDLDQTPGSDCNGNNRVDTCDINDSTSQDCDVNGIPDDCEISVNAALDCDNNGELDSCQLTSGTSNDCNGNTVLDSCEIASGSADCNNDSIPDDCQNDCDGNSIPDDCDLSSGSSADCNSNGVPDSCDISGGTDFDCDINGVIDECQITVDPNLDCDLDGVLQSCETDTDSDGVEDDCDTDDDNDNVLDVDDSSPLDNTICRDADADGCDDCSSGTDDSTNDGFDFDADGLCDIGDPDDDNDGVLDGVDSDDNNANICSDTDGDSCDDCSSGIFNTDDDGFDFDGDGICDLGDTDDDNDGALDRNDSDDNNANICSDLDGDGCDDCSAGSFDLSNDGFDFDGDGTCDLGDTDDDNDGALDDVDSDDNNVNVCSDNDGDGCDDCSSGIFDPANDGFDFDGDGTCDLGDTDDDNDGALDDADSDDNNVNICSDSDGDGCDDCSGGSYNPNNDGFDFDGDGICDFGDTDDDNDGALDRSDSDDNNSNICSDTDFDGCDDCSGGSYDPNNDGSDLDGDGICDLGDTDIDGDGIPNLCDVDQTGGFDCDVNGQDDSCQTDTDADGTIDACDNDLDGDGIPNICDADQTGGSDCDSNGQDDSCETDFDNDGIIDTCDEDDDNDGALDSDDSDDNNINICSDLDGDGCEDCSSGTFDPANDGIDTDSDGLCDFGDTDLDGDGVDNNCDTDQVAGTDCNSDSILDSCQGSLDFNTDGIPDVCQGNPFIRGDGNRDGNIDITDAVHTLRVLFDNFSDLCLPALDFNADQQVDISDVSSELNYIFLGTSPPSAPFPNCGIPQGATDSCSSFNSCP